MENCNCANGSYGKKHTDSCFRGQISSLEAELDKLRKENERLRAELAVVKDKLVETLAVALSAQKQLELTEADFADAADKWGKARADLAAAKETARREALDEAAAEWDRQKGRVDLVDTEAVSAWLHARSAEGEGVTELKDLTDKITPENLHELVDYGPDVGKEIEVQPEKAEVIQFKRNEVGFAHVICSTCKGNLFIVEVNDDNCFTHLVCQGCGAAIPVCIKPVWNAEGGE